MADVKDAYTTKKMAELVGMTRQAVDQRAPREGWQSRPRPGRGGGNVWLLSSMPEATRLAVAAAVAESLAKKQPAPAAISPEVFTVNTLHAVPERKRGRATARALLVSMTKEFEVTSGSARSVAREVFCHEYNRGAIIVPAWVRELLPKVCRASLTNWEASLGKEGLAALVGKHGQHRKGSGVIEATSGMADVVIAHISSNTTRSRRKRCWTP